MQKIKLVEFLVWALPIKSVQDYLIRRYLLTDEAYSRKIAGLDEVRGILMDSGELKEIPSLWPKVRNELRSYRESRSSGMRSGLRWAIQGLGLCLVLVLGIWMIRHPKSERASTEVTHPGSFQIQSIRLENKPATTFIFQPKDSKFIMVWAEKIG